MCGQVRYCYGRTINPHQTAQASGNPMIVTLTRGNGALVSHQYDSGSGQVTSYTHHALNNLVHVIPPVGQPTTIGYVHTGAVRFENARGAFTTYTWDDENRLTKVTYPNNSCI